MPIQGLTNQWQTYDALLDRFAALPNDEALGSVGAKHRLIRDLLAQLHQSIDSIVYVGTSHSTMNFATRDAVSSNEQTRPFAIVDVVVADETAGQYMFRVETREIDSHRPTSKWIVRNSTKAESVADMIREALLYADVAQRQSKTIG